MFHTKRVPGDSAITHNRKVIEGIANDFSDMRDLTELAIECATLSKIVEHKRASEGLGILCGIIAARMEEISDALTLVETEPHRPG